MNSLSIVRSCNGSRFDSRWSYVGLSLAILEFDIRPASGSLRYAALLNGVGATLRLACVGLTLGVSDAHRTVLEHHLSIHLIFIRPTPGVRKTYTAHVSYYVTLLLVARWD